MFLVFLLVAACIEALEMLFPVAEALEATIPGVREPHPSDSARWLRALPGG